VHHNVYDILVPKKLNFPPDPEAHYQHLLPFTRQQETEIQQRGRNVNTEKDKTGTWIKNFLPE